MDEDYDNYDHNMSRKGRRCKSHSIFGALELFRWAHQSKSDRRRNSKIEIGDQITIDQQQQQQRNAAKRHHSVSFAPINVTTVFPGGNNNNSSQNNKNNNNNKLLGNRRNYSSSCRHPTSLHNSGGVQHHHGSVMSLVMARKNGTGAGDAKMMARRPSTPSLPMSIVHAVSNTLPFNKHSRVRKAMSMLSLDGDDSAFVSECSSSSASSTFSSSSSSSSKRDSGLSTTKVEDELPPSPWKFEQYNNSGRNSNNEDEDELYDDQFATSIGHLMASRPRIALQHLRIAQHDRTVIPAAAEEVLCAEGNTQAYLLSLVAPPGKRVVNIGRDSGVAAATEATRECRRRHSEHRLLKYNLNNLNPCD